jgi:hypothetical protein
VWTGAYTYFGAVWSHAESWDSFDIKKAAKTSESSNKAEDSDNEEENNANSKESVEANVKSAMKSSTERKQTRLLAGPDNYSYLNLWQINVSNRWKKSI